jgi:hypothetical protein
MAAILACVFKSGEVGMVKAHAQLVPAAHSKRLPRIETTSPAMQRRTTTNTRSATKINCQFSASSTLQKPSTAKFWFLKPGALPATVADGSPYHTIHVANTTRSSTSPKSPSGTDKYRSPSKRTRKKTVTVSPAVPPHPLMPPPVVPVGSCAAGSYMSSAGSESNLEQFVSPHYFTWNRTSRSNSLNDQIPTVDDVASEADVCGKENVDMRASGGGSGSESVCNWSTLLDPTQADLYESLRQVYANCLMNEGMLVERSALLKFSNRPTFLGGWPGGPEMVVDCSGCDAQSVASANCPRCSSVVMQCAVCRLPVRGLASRCDLCGHGGHWAHWSAWFRGRGEEVRCPTGCGCQCWATIEEVEEKEGEAGKVTQETENETERKSGD